ncbi:MAG TPA: hypothetical protein VHM00_03130, partial [Caldimonas sp.]
MELSSGTSAPRRASLPRVAGVPALLEGLAVLAAIVLLLPLFAQVGELGAGRDDRFRAEPGFALAELPGPVLPELCPVHAGPADAAVREALCADVGERAATLPAPLSASLVVQRLERIAHAFALPVQHAELRLQRLRVQAEQPGEGEPAVADAIAAVEADIEPYLQRFRMTRSGILAPAPLRCAAGWAEAALASSPADRAAGDRAIAARSNAVLLLGAALDGRLATEAVAAGASLPPTAGTAAAGCRAGATAVLADTAALMADARESAANARKSEAMRSLLASAGWQWAGAMLLGYALLLLGRRGIAPALGVAVALAAWTAAAWLARVPWPLAWNREFEPARLDLSLASAPHPFVLWLAAGAAAALLGFLLRRQPAGAGGRWPRQSMSSRIGYAGLVLATGVGWLLLLDLSSQGLHANRYLALYHHGHLWLGMLTLSLLVFLRQPLSQALAWLLSVGGEAAHRTVRRLGPPGALGLLLLLSVGLLAAF